MSTCAKTGTEEVACAWQEHCGLVTRWLSSLRGKDGATDFSGRSVLVAEVDPVLAGSMQLFISRGFNCEVWLANSREEMVRILDSEAVDVLVISLDLAEPEPLDFIAGLRDRYEAPDIIALKSGGEGPLDVDLFDARVLDVISKPFAPSELQAKLEQVFWGRVLADEILHGDSQYRKIFELNFDAMLIVDPETGVIQSANNAFGEFAGLAPLQLRGHTITEYLAPGEEERFQAGLMVCSSRGHGTVGGISLATRGGQRLFDVTTTFYGGYSKRLACLSFKDISERHDLELRLSEVVQKDALTQLYNQRSFQIRIEGAVAAARHTSSPLALMLIDLDNFKACNDTHGHQTGDMVLQTVGRLIFENVRGGHDEGFRCGGDEFALLLRGADMDVAVKIGERIQSLFSETLNYGTTISMGLALYEPTMNSKAFIQAADRALYRAKLTGKSCIVVWETAGAGGVAGAAG